MTRVCVCCESESVRTKLAEYLRRYGFECANEPRADAALLIVPRLSRANWADEVLRLARESGAGIIILTKPEDVSAVEKKLQGCGAIVLGCDVSPTVLEGALLAASKAGERLNAARQEANRLREKLECERIVARAKVLLVEQKHMTEHEAHRYIEKAAMDRRVPRRQIAERILKGEL